MVLYKQISALLLGVLFASQLVTASPQSSVVDFSDDYERIFQIRVVSLDAGGKASIGSGFQVSADGQVITNYHVVSDYVNSPDSYEIRYVSHSGQSGLLALQDFDVVGDLAVLMHPLPETEFFTLAHAPLARGERAYALGNPGDWGVVMVPGPTNGLVEHSYEERVLFSGSLNPGMSGGPSLNRHGRVVGVNVATAGSQLSFLVPVSKVSTLLGRDRRLPKDSYQREISTQIKSWQRPRVQELIDSTWTQEDFSTRTLFGEIRSDFQCWGDTNETDDEREIAKVSKTCRAGDDLYIGSDLTAGQIRFSFKTLKPVKLNTVQFARALGTYMSAANDSSYRHSTNFRCETDFIAGKSQQSKSYGRVITCIRAYKNLSGLYDSLLLVQDRTNREAFVAQLKLAALEKDQIQALNKRFVEQSL